MQYVRILAKCSVRSRHLAKDELVPVEELGKDADVLVRMGRAIECVGPAEPAVLPPVSQGQAAVAPDAPSEKKRGKRVR